MTHAKSATASINLIVTIGHSVTRATQLAHDSYVSPVNHDHNVSRPRFVHRELSSRRHTKLSTYATVGIMTCSTVGLFILT